MDCRGHHGRSIPACAGEPLAWPSTFPAATVYPRVCGGTQIKLAGLGRAAGLSPRVRGNRRPPFPPPDLGSIPACAGEPEFAAAQSDNWQVYPRVCGGTIPA